MSIDIPDELYRALNARAALSGVTLRDLLLRLIEQGLRQLGRVQKPEQGRREPPPVIIPPRGRPIAAVSRAELHRLEEEEDQARHARFARR